jgi:hypothetical protein
MDLNTAIVFTHAAMQKEEQCFDLYFVYCFVRVWQTKSELHTGAIFGSLACELNGAFVA